MISITLIPPANTDRLFCRPTPATMALGLGALQTPASTLDPSIEQPSTPPIRSSLAVIAVPGLARRPRAGFAGSPLHPPRPPNPHSVR